MNVAQLENVVKYAQTLKVPTNVRVHLVIFYYQMEGIAFLAQVRCFETIN